MLCIKFPKARSGQLDNFGQRGGQLPIPAPPPQTVVNFKLLSKLGVDEQDLERVQVLQGMEALLLYVYESWPGYSGSEDQKGAELYMAKIQADRRFLFTTPVVYFCHCEKGYKHTRNPNFPSRGL